MKQTQSILVAIALLITLPALAQKEETVVGSRGMGFSGIWGGYKHQITQLGNKKSYINGGFFGLEFGKSLLVGFGNYTLVDEFNWNSDPKKQLNIKWRPFLLQYGVQNFRSIHPQAGFEIGRGRITLGSENDHILVMQPTLGVEINIFRWFHFGIDGGYRFVSDTAIDDLRNDDLSGWFGQATFKFGFSWGKYHQQKPSKSPRTQAL
jgi:hypothetical protein